MLRLRFIIPAIGLALGSLAVTPWSRAACDTTCGLSDYNRDVLLEYLLNGNTAPLAAASVDAFFALTPAGIESREDVLNTVGKLDITAAEIYTHRIEVTGDTAVLAGKIRASGTIGGRPVPELGFLSVFALIDGEWRLVARSLTPQLSPSPGSGSSTNGQGVGQSALPLFVR